MGTHSRPRGGRHPPRPPPSPPPSPQVYPSDTNFLLFAIAPPEHAQPLYKTMAERGVSQLVSVNLQEADRMVA